MRVEVHPADQGGCGHYRAIWPTKAAAEQGADCALTTQPLRGICLQPDDPFGDDVCTGLLEIPEADVVVLQRPLRSELVTAIPHLQAAGIAVVVEVDDNFARIHPQNVAWPAAQPYWHPRDKLEAKAKAIGRAIPHMEARTYLGMPWYRVPGWKGSSHFNWLAEACRLADLVTVSTPALAKQYGRHGRCVVLPNYVPQWYLSVEREPKERPAIGWTGSVRTHPEDIETLKGAWGRFSYDHPDWDDVVVGAGEGVAERAGLPSVLACGWRPLDEYPVAMAQLDIGLVPLRQSAFNEAKSYLKGLEFAALGVPFLASPTPEYRKIGGLAAALPSGADSWYVAMAELAANEQLRIEVAAAARRACQELTIEHNAHLWPEAWQQAVANHHRRRRPSTAI